MNAARKPHDGGTERERRVRSRSGDDPGDDNCDSNFKQRSYRDTASRSRRTFREVCCEFRPSPNRGRGEAGRPMRPIAACAMIVVERTRVSQVTPESPGTPRAVFYSLSRALPGDQTWDCHRHRQCLNRRLDASLEASGPHAFAVRFRCSRLSIIRGHRIPAPRP